MTGVGGNARPAWSRKGWSAGRGLWACLRGGEAGRDLTLGGGPEARQLLSHWVDVKMFKIISGHVR